MSPRQSNTASFSKRVPEQPQRLPAPVVPQRNNLVMEVDEESKGNDQQVDDVRKMMMLGNQLKQNKVAGRTSPVAHQKASSKGRVSAGCPKP